MAAAVAEYTRADVERLLRRWRSLREAAQGKGLVADLSSERVQTSGTGGLSAAMTDLLTLEAAWAKLPSGPKRALWWLYGLDKPAGELAEIMRCSERTIWNWRREGVAILTDILNGAWSDGFADSEGDL